MVRVKNVRTRRNGGAGSQRVSSSRRRSLSSRNAAEVFVICSLEIALCLFGPGGKFYDPLIEASLRGFEQSEQANSVGERHDSEDDNHYPFDDLDDYSVEELQMLYAQTTVKLMAIKRRIDELRKLRNEEIARLLSRPMDELTVEEMIELRTILKEVQDELLNQIVQMASEPSRAAESSSFDAAESFECSDSIAHGGSDSDDADLYEKN